MARGLMGRFLAIFVFVLMLGCTPREQVAPLAESESVTDGQAIDATNRQSGSAEIRPTIKSQPANVTTEQKATAPTSWDEIERWLSDARQAGSDINAVHQQLVASGWQEAGSGISALDITGDGEDEWVLLLKTPNQDPGLWGPTGNLLVMDQAFVVYRLHANFDQNDRQMTVPKLLATGDITGDGVSELFVDHPLCGAHTCSMQLRVLYGGTGTIENIVWRGANLSAAEQTIQISDATLMLDSAQNLKVTGGGVGSLGAGVPRLYTEIWSFSAESRRLTLDSTELQPSNMRHHMLYEANALSENEELGTAIEVYQSVIHDDTLENAASLSEGSQTIYEDARQFAAFRLVWLGIISADNELIGEYRDWLLNNATNLTITRAAQAMIDAPNETVACAAAQRILKEVEHPAGAVTYMGYANPTLTHDSFCP